MPVKPSAPGPIRVFLVDDHPLLRKGIANCINGEPGLQVCGEAGNAAEALTTVAQLRPDVVLVDISIPGRDGIELIKELRAQRTPARLLVFSMHDESLYALRALRAGASGYVMKSDSEHRLLQAIRSVHAGKVVVSQQLDAVLIRQALGLTAPKTADEPADRLTDRELQILRLIGEGRQRKEIAKELNLSAKTIESHRTNLCEKLRLPDTAALQRYALGLAERESNSVAAPAAKQRGRKIGPKPAKRRQTNRPHAS
jgi:DNA-binding NarL/FixJ family response regulator